MGNIKVYTYIWNTPSVKEGNNNVYRTVPAVHPNIYIYLQYIQRFKGQYPNVYGHWLYNI